MLPLIIQQTHQVYREFCYQLISIPRMVAAMATLTFYLTLPRGIARQGVGIILKIDSIAMLISQA